MNLLLDSHARLWDSAEPAKMRAEAVKEIRNPKNAVFFSAASASAHLPWHHTDPFDRLLIAQALAKNFSFSTRDSFAGLYGVTILKV